MSKRVLRSDDGFLPSDSVERAHGCDKLSVLGHSDEGGGWSATNQMSATGAIPGYLAMRFGKPGE
jgi:hypothetical protein